MHRLLLLGCTAAEPIDDTPGDSAAATDSGGDDETGADSGETGADSGAVLPTARLVLARTPQPSPTTCRP